MVERKIHGAQHLFGFGDASEVQRQLYANIQNSSERWAASVWAMQPGPVCFASAVVTGASKQLLRAQVPLLSRCCSASLFFLVLLTGCSEDHRWESVLGKGCCLLVSSRT